MAIRVSYILFARFELTIYYLMRNRDYGQGGLQWHRATNTEKSSIGLSSTLTTWKPERGCIVADKSVQPKQYMED